jgi:hypothetical protein
LEKEINGAKWGTPNKYLKKQAIAQLKKNLKKR